MRHEKTVLKDGFQLAQRILSALNYVASRLKKIVLNVLRLETATATIGRISLAKKRKLAAWDDTFRMAIMDIKPIYGN